MEDRLAAIEASLAALERRVDELAARTAATELRVAGLPASAAVRRPEPVVATAHRTIAEVNLLGLTGRSLIILGGAYLLRALTEGGTLPALVGVALGLLYALGWFMAAGRAASRQRGADATFHGIVGSIIAFPLIVEATVRFGFLGPAAGAVSIAALTAFALAIAWYTRHEPTAWCVTLGALGAAVAMIPMTGVVLPYSAFLFVLGLATLWLGYDRGWKALRWPVAIFADILAIGLVVRATTPEPRDSPDTVMAMLIALVGGYLASFAGRTLVRGRNVIPFEVFQTAAVLVVGVGGAIAVVRATGAGTEPLGLTTLALAAGSYAVAFAFVDRRQGLGVNFYFYTSLALVCTLVGLPLLLPPTGVTLVGALLAIAGTWLGARLGRAALSVHGAIYVLQAAMTSGLLGHATLAYTGHDQQLLGLPSLAALTVLAAAAMCALAKLPVQSDIDIGWCTGVRGVETVILAFVAGGVAIAFTMWIVGSAVHRPLQGAEVAVTRTVVLSASSLFLIIMGRAGRLVGASRLAYLVLAITGAQVLFEDLGEAGPGLLVVAFASYGAALILVPHVSRLPAAAPHARGDDARAKV